MLLWLPLFLIEPTGTDDLRSFDSFVVGRPGRALPVLPSLDRIPVSRLVSLATVVSTLVLDRTPTSRSVVAGLGGRFNFARVALVDSIGLTTSRFVYLDTREAVPPPAWDVRVYKIIMECNRLNMRVEYGK